MVSQEPRVAIGIDVTVRTVSLARMTEGKPTPICMPISSPDAGTAHSVASTLSRHRATVQAVMEAVMKRGRPDAVVMVKDHWMDMKTDASAQRRAGLWWLLADALVAENIPVAEVPLLTLSSWAGAKPMPGKAGADALSDRLKTFYPTLASPGRGYRLTTVAAALAGAMACGIDTEISATTDRLNCLRGYAHADDRTRSNRGVQWPASLKPPASLGEWVRRNERREDVPAAAAG